MYNNDPSERAMSSLLFKATVGRVGVVGLVGVDPGGVETGQGEGRRDQVGLGNAPEYLAGDARGDAGSEKGGGGRFGRALRAAGHFVEGAERQPATGQAPVDRVEPKRQSARRTPFSPLDPGNPGADRKSTSLNSSH